MRGRAANRAGMEAAASRLTPEQLQAIDRWRGRWTLPLVVAALLPFFVTSPKTQGVAVFVGLGSWVVFVIDLAVQLHIDRDYLHTRPGKVDLGIVLLTFPYYLIPGAGEAVGLLMVARLARLVRLVIATKGLHRFVARLGKVAAITGVVVLVASLAAYETEHASNPGYATFGDALWWGVVTLTTVGYGDVVPRQNAGRLAGVAIMFTGIAVLGILAGSLSSLFRLSDKEEEEEEEEKAQSSEESAVEKAVAPTTTVLHAQLIEIERRIGELTELVRAGAPPGGPG